MTTLADWQRRFIAAMHHPESRADADLGQPTGLDVYRNNIRQSLIDALATAFPHTRTLLGARFFAAAAGDYAHEHPPTDPRLMHYGHGFADCLERLPPLVDYRYVGDICRLERARLDVSHAAETPAIDAPRLAEHPDPEGLVLVPRPATRLVTCHHDVTALWRRLEDDGGTAPLGKGGAMAWLAVRLSDRVTLTPVTPAACGLYLALQDAGALGEALATSAKAHGEVAAGEALGTLLGLGALGAPAELITEDAP